ncbi:MAG TPA: RnfABCDGE type electron transport complex subunit D [Patescibacteria group bacterium]|nr:RnfABCDGE type electron transport complex subunit D [Patescibacteria group bacterium]
MFKTLDKFLNRITMYKLVMYSLVVLLFWAYGVSLAGKLPFHASDLVYTIEFLIASNWVLNKLFAWIFRVPANVESPYITAMILALIISPAADQAGFLFLFWASLIAMGSKYLIAYRRRHIFNPAALAVVATFYLLGMGASWWVGNVWMVIPVIIMGVLFVRKTRRWNMVYTFLAVTILTTLAFSLYEGAAIGPVLKALVVYSPLVFFATVMFTEPATTPPTQRLQIIYGIIVGVLASPFTHFGNFYMTPELALVFGNVYSYAVGSKERLQLTLAQKRELSGNVWEFVFEPLKFKFRPGQYLEWTIRHKADLRGNRRYFTIASSPTEDNLRLGVKFYDKSSSFKKTLQDLPPGSKLFAGQLAGDFTLPSDPSKKLVFIAGGIGITPYRSMLKYLLDKNEKRPAILFFSNRNADEIVYRDVLDEASEKLGIKTVYTLTGDVPADWAGERGRLDADKIVRHVPDYKERTFYISGTQNMVTSTKDLLSGMGVAGRRIKTDFFPGYV